MMPKDFVPVLHTCPCGLADSRRNRKVFQAVVMQMAVLGDSERQRAKAVTVYMCGSCIRLIKTKAGRPVRHALADAIQQMAVSLNRKMVPYGT